MFHYSNFNPFQPPKPEPAKKPEQPKPPAGPPAPPRMAIMVCNGKEVMVALPQSHDKALAAAVAAFEVPNTYATRLAVKDIPPWLQKFNAGDILFIADDASYQYCISGRQVVRFEVIVFEKAGAPASTTTATKPGSSCPIDLICESKKGNVSRLLATAQTENDLTKNPPIGTFVGTLRISNNPLKIEFVGKEE